MASVEIALVGLPGWAWVLGLLMLLGLLLGAGWMVAHQLMCLDKVHLVQMAYRQPRLLRISQSPTWSGALLASLGALLIALGLLWPSADAHVFAIANRAWRAKRAGEVTIDLVRDLRREQAPWVALRARGTSALQGTWAPSEDRSDAQNAAAAARLVGKASALKAIGLLLALFGGLFILVKL